MPISPGVHCAISVAAILGTSDLWTLDIPPRQKLAGLPIAAALVTVLFITAAPDKENKKNKVALYVSLALLAGISIASLFYTPKSEEDLSARTITHYTLQGLLLLAVCIGGFLLST
jgi:FtsH-binding integral membrane protein